MKVWMMVSALLLTLAFGAMAQAAAPSKVQSVTPPASAAFSLEGRVLRVAKGRIELQVTRIEQAARLKAGQRIWIQETARTKVMEYGKTMAASALKAGERVEVNGRIMKTKMGSTYDAATITVVASR